MNANEDGAAAAADVDDDCVMGGIRTTRDTRFNCRRIYMGLFDTMRMNGDYHKN